MATKRYVICARVQTALRLQLIILSVAEWIEVEKRRLLKDYLWITMLLRCDHIDKRGRLFFCWQLQAALMITLITTVVLMLVVVVSLLLFFVLFLIICGVLGILLRNNYILVFIWILLVLALTNYLTDKDLPVQLIIRTIIHIAISFWTLFTNI